MTEFVQSAIHDARVAQDERGLVPIAEARSLVEKTKLFVKGEGEMKDGTFVLESDRVWAALLSLEDARELVQHAKRIEWRFHVRGRDNIALFERYGAGILPWIESRLEENGVLYNIPWCVLPCLLAMDTKEALELALRVQAVHELLPDQPALGGGPGAFAADRDPSAKPEKVTPETARTTDGHVHDLDIARNWMEQHPRWEWLAQLADGGNERARTVMLERAKSSAGVIRETLQNVLGADEADRLAKKLDIPESSLPPAVKAILDESAVDDEPRGPIWDVSALEDILEGHDQWECPHHTTGAMRIHGFASRHGDALVIEYIYTQPDVEEWIGHTLVGAGPGVKNTEEIDHSLVDGEADELEDLDLESCVIDGIANQIVVGKRRVASPLPHEYTIVHVARGLEEGDGIEMHAPHQLPRTFTPDPRLRAVTPQEGLLLQLCAKHKDQMFARVENIAKHLGFDPNAKRLFVFDDFDYPLPEKGPSLDLVTMVEALRARKKITRLPGTANTRPEIRMPRMAEIRAYKGVDAWAEGEDPIEPEMKEGTGISPYWSWLISARKYPHGAMLMHGPEWNQEGQAEQTVPYLIEHPKPAMHVFWPRRTAIKYMRALGFAKKEWSNTDPGVKRAMKGEDLPDAPQAETMIASFATRAFPMPAHTGTELVDLCEALTGAEETLAGVCKAIASLPAEAWTKDNSALASAVFELGFVLTRVSVRKEQHKSKLAKLYDASRTNDVARALDLVLHDKEGAERSAKSELDYAHVTDHTWAKERILASSPSRPSALLLSICGDALIDKYMSRLDSEDVPFLVTQLGKIKGARAISALCELWTKNETVRASVEQAFEARPIEDRKGAPSALLDALELRRVEADAAKEQEEDDEDDED